MKNLENFKNADSLKLHLASPEEIKTWSYGEVTKPETINYRTFKAEKEGLFDERIFGPRKMYECQCGKYKGIRYKGVVCDKCGVEVENNKVRRERLGHIDLAAPVFHIWYLKGMPSILSTLLAVPAKHLESVIYYSSYIVLDIDEEAKTRVLSELEVELKGAKEKIKIEIQKEKEFLQKEYEGLTKSIEDAKELKKFDKKFKKELAAIEKSEEKTLQNEIDRIAITKRKINFLEQYSTISDIDFYDIENYLAEFVKCDTGAEAILEILESLDLVDLAVKTREQLDRNKGQNKIKISRRLKLIESFRRSKVEPSSMALKILPVLPPEARPIVPIDGGRFASSDLNDLYRRIINRNNRLKRLIAISAPKIILKNEKRMLQEAVDGLIDSKKARKPSLSIRGSKELKSLTQHIAGKTGRFRQNLLGKRVDFSGRSVITVNPELKVDECGLPKKMAIELFKPFILRDLLMRGLAPNLRSAKIMIDERKAIVYDILDKVVLERPVMLNRPPTLHRLGFLGFKVVLVEGNAIQIHPAICPGFNADFDGDQMAVHVPLTDAAVKEVREKIISTNNFLKPSTGEFVNFIGRDMPIGLYEMTIIDGDTPKSEKVYTFEDVKIAYEYKKLSLTQPIYVINRKNEIDEKIVTTAGRVFINASLPEDYPYLNDILSKKTLKKMNIEIYRRYGKEETANFIDNMKDFGFGQVTKSGFSISILDIKQLENRDSIIEEALEKEFSIEDSYMEGLLTEEESAEAKKKIWRETSQDLTEKTFSNIEESNPVKVIVNSGGAKAGESYIGQIAGVFGNLPDSDGQIMGFPLLSNYRKGTSALEFFTLCKSSRKGLVDKGLRTADAGYLTRRLHDAAQNIIISEDDCNTKEGIVLNTKHETNLIDFYSRLEGRVSLNDIKDGEKILVAQNEIFTKANIATIQEAGITEVILRSPITCSSKHGICQKCYGTDLTTQEFIAIGTAAGVIAAQAIGEPGTQLTMRTFYSAGGAGGDITSGLPRVEEIFEARSPKAQALMSDVKGKVKLLEEKGKRKIVIRPISNDDNQEEIVYKVAESAEILVKDGDLVIPGTELSLGYLDLKDLLSVVGAKDTQRYIIEQIQKVYSSQGVEVDDKHIEIIVRQMFNKVEVVDSGDTSLLAGEVVLKSAFNTENEKIAVEGGNLAKAKVVLLGITRTAITTDSFLASASFEQTSKVLTMSSIKGEEDYLRGLKENVIIGGLLPVGSNVKKDK